MSELLPCPFCSGEARLLGGGIIDGIERGYMVECHDCHASTKKFGADNAQEAIEAWNTRAEQPTVAVANVNFTKEQLEKLKQEIIRELTV